MLLKDELSIYYNKENANVKSRERIIFRKPKPCCTFFTFIFHTFYFADPYNHTFATVCLYCLYENIIMIWWYFFIPTNRSVLHCHSFVSLLCLSISFSLATFPYQSGVNGCSDENSQIGKSPEEEVKIGKSSYYR